MTILTRLSLLVLVLSTLSVTAQSTKRSGNPVFPGWYADPEGAIFGNRYWIYPTYSDKYEKQVHFDAFSSPDLVNWTKHPRILDSSAVKWAKKAMWAPAIVQKGGQYFLFFGANDVHPGEVGGIGVAVANNPAGPFLDHIGKPLVGEVHNGAQPIDQFVFRDTDGKEYLIYGGWGHCNIAQLTSDYKGFIPFATDHVQTTIRLLDMLNSVRERFSIPAQTCVLSHLTTTLQAIEQGAPVDLAFQSIGGTEGVNASFGVNLGLLQEGLEATRSLKRGTLGQHVMYFETGQGSALSANAHCGLDQQTAEVRAYAVARAFEPLLVNSVVGFIGPEYLYDGKQIIRAGLEDHCCGKLLGLPMGVDICYTNHAEADQDDMDTLLTVLGTAGVTFIMGIPGADDVMLHYQSTSFHDALYIRQLLNRRPSPEFEQWLMRMGLLNDQGQLLPAGTGHRLLTGM